MIQGLYALLSQYEPLTNVIGTSIYQSVLPSNAVPPALTYYIVRSSQTAISTDKRFTTKETIEFDCWGTTYSDADTARNALHALLDMYTGTMPDGTEVIYTSAANIPDMVEEYSKLYRCGVEFVFTHY